VANKLSSPRIGILTTSYPRSLSDEAGIFVKRLVEAWNSLKLSGLVIVPFDENEPFRETQGGFRVLRYKYGLFKKGRLAFGAGILPNLRQNPLLALQIPGLIGGMTRIAFLARKEYDIMQANWLPAGVAAWLNHLLCRKPYTVTVRGEDAKFLQSRTLKYFFAPVLHHAAAVISVSKGFYKTLEDGFRLEASKLHYIPNGVEIVAVDPKTCRDFVQARGLNPDEKYLLYVGRLIPLKRLEKLVELINAPGMQDYKLLVCGAISDQEYYNKLKELISRLECQQRVVFTGRVPPKEVPYYLAIAACYVSASEYEGRPNSILEAQAAGKVVFASDIAAHREVITPGQTGFLFDPGDLPSAAKKILEVHADSALQKMLARNCRKEACLMSWKACALHYHAVFASILRQIQGTEP